MLTVSLARPGRLAAGLAACATLGALASCGSGTGGLDKSSYDAAVGRIVKECENRGNVWRRTVAPTRTSAFAPLPELKAPLTSGFHRDLGYVTDKLERYGDTKLSSARGTVRDSLESVLALRLTGDPGRCGGGASRTEARRLAGALGDWGQALERVDRECRARDRKLHLLQDRAKKTHARFPVALSQPASPMLNTDVSLLIDRVRDRHDPILQSGSLDQTLSYACGGDKRTSALGARLGGAVDATS